MGVEAVIWDFGGVFTSSPFEAFNRYEAEKGLPRDLTAAHADTLLTIPSRPQVRSLNLSNCAAIVAYEAVRQREAGR